jgi:hypothetical protein
MDDHERALLEVAKAFAGADKLEEQGKQFTYSWPRCKECGAFEREHKPVAVTETLLTTSCAVCGKEVTQDFDAEHYEMDIREYENAEEIATTEQFTTPRMGIRYRVKPGSHSPVLSKSRTVKHDWDVCDQFTPLAPGASLPDAVLERIKKRDKQQKELAEHGISPERGGSQVPAAPCSEVEQMVDAAIKETVIEAQNILNKFISFVPPEHDYKSKPEEGWAILNGTKYQGMAPKDVRVNDFIWDWYRKTKEGTQEHVHLKPPQLKDVPEDINPGKSEAWSNAIRTDIGRALKGALFDLWAMK